MKTQFVDLSHPISETMPHWPGDPQTRISQCASPQTDGFFLQSVTFGEHSGTHLGAPRHFCRDGASVDELPPNRLIVAIIKLDITRQAAANRDYLVSVDDLQTLEATSLTDKALLLIHTGWDRHWCEPARYLGIGDDGLHFPGISAQAVDYVAQNRQIVGIGIDTAGLDGGQSSDFSSNRRCAQYGLYHLENLTNLEKISKKAWAFIGALPFVGGSGSPCRVIAQIEG